MSSEWYIQKDGKVFGPHSPSKLKEGASKGLLSPDDMVRKGENGNWVKASKVKGLFDAVENMDVSETEDPLRAPVAAPTTAEPPLDPKQEGRMLLRLQRAHEKVRKAEQKRRITLVVLWSVSGIVVLCAIPIAFPAGWVAGDIARESYSDREEYRRSRQVIDEFERKGKSGNPDQQELREAKANIRRHDTAYSRGVFVEWLVGILTGVIWLVIAVIASIIIAKRTGRRGRLAIDQSKRELAECVEELQQTSPKWVADWGGAATLLDFQQFNDELRLSGVSEVQSPEGPQVVFPSPQVSPRSRLSLVWEILIFVGATLLCIAVWTDWWAMSFRIDLKDQSRAQATLRIVDSNESFYKRKGFHGDIIDKLARKPSRWESYRYYGHSLWGWNFGTGATGFIFGIVLIIMTPVTIFVPVLRRWCWIVWSVGAIMGLLLLIFWMVFIFGVPSGYSSGVRHSIEEGPWIFLPGAILVFGACLTHALTSLFAFLKWRKTRTQVRGDHAVG